MTFTAFAFPEPPDRQTGASDRRLVFILPSPPDDPVNTLLDRIAGALNASLQDSVHCIVQEPGQAVALPSFPAGSQALVISFGVPPEVFGWWLEAGSQDLVRLEGVTLIRTLAPGPLATDTTAKKVLWAHMQAYLEFPDTGP